MPKMVIAFRLWKSGIVGTMAMACSLRDVILRNSVFAVITRMHLGSAVDFAS